MTLSDSAAGETAPRLLARPPEEGARLLALAFLDQAVEARPRLDDPEDGEALHDFRVALRRLRSTLRAYRDHLGESVPKKLARKLRKIAGATGEGRDAEVQIEWLRGAGKTLTATQRPGSAWLLGRLEEARKAAYAEIRSEVADDFESLATDLREALSVYRTEVRLDRDVPRATLGAAAADILHRQRRDLREHLEAIAGPGDEPQAHRARIAAKRLRYLLEPFRGEVAPAAGAVQQIKSLQEVLGELHDAHVLESALSQALAKSAEERAERLFDLALADPPDERRLQAERRRRHEPGLLALARRNRERRDRLYGELAQGWLEGRADGVFEDLADLETGLAGTGRSAEGS
jgi:CHAD domain-containing protein